MNFVGQNMRKIHVNKNGTKLNADQVLILG